MLLSDIFWIAYIVKVSYFTKRNLNQNRCPRRMCHNKSSFTGKYHCYYLFYYEHFTHIEHAIEREKQIKKWRREKKDALITSTNPEWRFLNKETNSD
jgi:predicted GIY-YIG superfamily endonuclease